MISERGGFAGLKIGQRIFLGFAAILVVLLLVSLSGYVAFRDTGTHIEAFVQRTRVADQARQLRLDVAELLRYTNRYGNSGDEENGRHARHAVEVIRTQLAAARATNANPEWAAHLTVEAEQIDAFSANLKHLIQAKTAQQQLVLDALDPSEVRFFETATRIANLGSRSNDPAVTDAVGQLLTHVLLVRTYISQALARHDANIQPRIVNEFELLKEILKTLEPKAAQNQLLHALNDAQATLPKYAAAFDQVVSLMFEIDDLLSGPMANESERLSAESATLAALASDEAKAIQEATLHSVGLMSR
ncbi:MAG: hypothetical protein JO370_16685, partial [Paucibacter sp.]|nr:hypothetical protein [Roseateles sp.]